MESHKSWFCKQPRDGSKVVMSGKLCLAKNKSNLAKCMYLRDIT